MPATQTLRRHTVNQVIPLFGRFGICQSLFSTTLACAFVLAFALTAAHAQYASVFNFDTTGTDLNSPLGGPMVQGKDGNLHGVTQYGGASSLGGAFKLTTGGTLTKVADFTSLEFDVMGGLILGTDGNYYSSDTSGGTQGFGSIFKVSSAGTVSTIYNFRGSSDGSNPSQLIQAADGNLYGTNTYSFFKVTTSGTFTLIHTFNQATEGTTVDYGVIQGTDGNFYGFANQGGVNGYGTVFKITAAGVVTVLHNFNMTDGWGPGLSPAQGSDGYIYGTTSVGGSFGRGVIFKVSTTGSGFTVLHNTNGTTDGYGSASSLIQATDGNFYGVMGTDSGLGSGTIYKITPSGSFSTLYTYNTTQLDYVSSLVQHTNGLLYGSMGIGGTSNVGLVYSYKIGAAKFARLATTSGKIGSTLNLFGQKFKTATSVSFAGVTTTSFSSNSTGTYLTVTVPTGAKTGVVTVNEPSGNLLSSQSFSVTPTITSFTPTSGPVGTLITVTGTGLTQTSKVTIGGINAPTFTGTDDSHVNVTVPTGGKTGPIAITTSGGTATSATNFTVN